MRTILALVATVTMVSACSFLSPKWHWEKSGGDYDQDERYCKTQTYNGTDGMVNGAMVKKMHACMEARGWRKVEN